MNSPSIPPASVRLTSFSHGGGCGCKVAPGLLTEILRGVRNFAVPKELMVGIETADDRLGTDLVEIPLLNAEQAAKNRELDERISHANEKVASITKQIPQAAQLADLTKKLPDLEAQLAKATTAASKSGSFRRSCRWQTSGGNATSPARSRTMSPW